MVEMTKELNSDYNSLLFEKSEDNLVKIEGGMYQYYASIRHSYYANELDMQILCFVPDNKYAQVFARVTLNAQYEYELPVVGIDVVGNDYMTHYNFNETKDIEQLVHEIFTEYTVPKLVNKIFWNVCTHQVLCHILPIEISELIIAST